MRVLIAEPREHYCEALKSLGEVCSASDALSFISHLAGGDYDAAVLHEDLPDLSLEEIVTLRQTAKEFSLPFVVLVRNPGRIAGLLHEGVTAALPLPTFPEELCAVVLGCVRNREGLSGSLQVVSLPEVIQLLSASRRSGVLRVFSEEEGSLFFSEGQLISAAYGKEAGEDAVRSALARGEVGTFFFRAAEARVEQNIFKRTDHLLLEIASALDEARRK